MRVFLIWADNGPEINNLISKLKKQGHEIVYWVGLVGGEKNAPPETIFHDHFAAWDSLPAEGIEINDFPPPGKDLIEKLYKTESLVLTMMNKRFDTYCVDKRRHLYYNMLQYWNGMIDKYKPEVIIFPIVPHTVYNYIIYSLAKLYGIKTIMFEDSWVSDRLLMYTDWEKSSELLKQTIEKNRGKNFSLDDLSEDIRNYYQLQTKATHDATPIYMQYWKKKFSGINILQRKLQIIKNSIKDGTFFEKVFGYFRKQFKPNLKKEYAGVQTSTDFSKPFIYVPLSFQPERTTSPQGDMFVDQILMVETISASLPKNWVIYVKEHPSQWWLRGGIIYSSSRYPGYYQRLAQIKNTYLIPIETNTYTLINRSQAVAVATGTAGWEAILRSKPALVFGYPWYRDCPSIFRIRNAETYKVALKKITDGYQIDQQEIINYLKSFDEATFHGYIESFIEKNSQLNKQESMNNITQTILAEIEKSNNLIF